MRGFGGGVARGKEEGGGGSGWGKASPKIVLGFFSLLPSGATFALPFFECALSILFFCFSSNRGKGESDGGDPTLTAWHHRTFQRIARWGQELGYTVQKNPATTMVHPGST